MTPTPYYLQLKIWLLFLLIIGFVQALYHINKKTQKGVNYASEILNIRDEKISFWYNLSFLDKNGQPVYNLQIFDNLLEMIKQSKEYILLDIFLFNEKTKTSTKRNIFKEIIEALSQQKQKYPNLEIKIITDHINYLHAKKTYQIYKELEKSGVEIIFTNVDKIRDNSYLYSIFYRAIPFKKMLRFIPFFNPIGENKFNLTNLYKVLHFLQFKANHRKVFICDESVCVTSMNLDQSSSDYCNVAVMVKDINFRNLVLENEFNIAKFSGKKLEPPKSFLETKIIKTKKTNSDLEIQLITEYTVKTKIFKLLKNCQKGDRVFIGALLFSDHQIMDIILKTTDRGVLFWIFLDPNNGIFHNQNLFHLPNSYTADLFKNNSNIKVGFYKSFNDIQFHSKIFHIQKNKYTQTIIGSSNLNRLSLENFNLETSLYIKSDKNSNFSKEIKNYINLIWEDYHNFLTETVDENPELKLTFCGKVIYKISHFFRFIL
jgi:cardiolipin synthase A/B